MQLYPWFLLNIKPLNFLLSVNIPTLLSENSVSNMSNLKIRPVTSADSGILNTQMLGLTWILTISFILIGLLVLYMLWPKNSHAKNLEHNANNNSKSAEGLFEKIPVEILNAEDSKIFLQQQVRASMPPRPAPKIINSSVAILGMHLKGCHILFEGKLQKGQVLFLKLDKLENFPLRDAQVPTIVKNTLFKESKKKKYDLHTDANLDFVLPINSELKDAVQHYIHNVHIETPSS